jgi:hypothetical protein
MIVKSFGGKVGLKTRSGYGSKFAFNIFLGKDRGFVDLMNQNERI